MNKYFLNILILLAACICCNKLIAQAQIRNTYRFYNTLSTTEPTCAPDLIPTKGLNLQCGPSTAATSGRFITDTLTSGVSRIVYHNNLNWGLKYLNTNGVIASTYTVQMYIKVTNFNRFYTRVIDFSNGVSDNGIYFTNYNTPTPITERCLNFYPNGNFGICPFFNDTTYYLLTITRNNTTKKVDIYVNDQLFTSYNDLTNFYISTANKPVHIFRDDPVGFACEDGEANFAYLSFANYYSTQADVSLIYHDIDTIASTADFLLAPSPACSGSDVTVTYNGNIPVNASGYIFNWNWDGGTVVSGSDRGPYSVRWSTTGNKNITLSITGGGCAATVTNTKQLLVNNSFHFQKDTTICFGNSYEGHSTSGSFIRTVASPSGCDSVITINLTVLPIAALSVDTTICFGASFEGHSTSGTYVQHFTNATGCDSTRTINLTVLPIAGLSLDTSICYGTSFEGHSTSGTYMQHFTNAAGCDSTRTINLTVLPIAALSIDTSICFGTSFEGHSISGTYVQHFTNAVGCDSTKTIRLNVLPIAVSSVDTTVCFGISFEGHSNSGTYVQHFTNAAGCDSTKTIHLIVLPAAASSFDTTICYGVSFAGHSNSGNYVEHFTNAAGCDSARTIRLTVLPISASSLDTSICKGASFEGHTSTGNYVQYFINGAGCDSTRTIRLTVSDLLSPGLGDKTNLCAGDSIVLSPGNFAGYLWQDGSTQKTYTVKKAGLYSVVVTDNCVNARAEIAIEESICDIFFPSAFTPNNDRKNETFRISQGNTFYQYHLVMYNRYGQKVFETSAPAIGWDGKIKGVNAAAGAYVWFCYYKKTAAQPLQLLKGSVVLFR